MSQPEEITQSAANPGAEPAAPATSAPAAAASQAAPLLMGVKLPIRILLGRTQLRLQEIAQLGSGAVVELDCSPNDPVEILVNDRIIARGEVVVVGGNYGVRITKMATRSESGEADGPNADLRNLSEQLR